MKLIIENELANGIGETLSMIFANNSAGVNWEAVHDNMLPLVQFARTQELFCRVPLNGKEKELPHAYSQIKSITDYLKMREKEEAEAGNKEREQYYKQEAEWGCALLEELKTEPQMSRLINFYQLVLNSWEDFKNWTVTYRMLEDLTKLEKGWRNDVQARMELSQILKNVSAEW